MNKLFLSTYGQGDVLVMLHGWGMHSGVWQDFAATIAQYRQVICIDLPGHGYSEYITPYELEHVAAVLLAAIPVEKFALLGWSLGGTIAIAMAMQCSERVLSLHLLATNPCFVQSEDWPGVASSVFQGFEQQLAEDSQLCQKHFLALQVYGQTNARVLLLALKKAQQLSPSAQQQALQAGLAILKQADFRQVLSTLTCPSQFILGGLDALVPAECAKAILALNNSNIQVSVIDGAGHLPFLTHNQALLDCLSGLVCPSPI